jgi:hypothetical protein
MLGNVGWSLAILAVAIGVRWGGARPSFSAPFLLVSHPPSGAIPVRLLQKSGVSARERA